MKKIVLSMVVLSMLAVLAACGTGDDDDTTPRTSYTVTITVKPNSTDYAIGVWGSVTTNAAGQFVFDGSWNGGNPLVAITTNDQTNANGELVFVLNNVVPSADEFEIQMRGSAIGDWSDTQYWSAPKWSQATAAKDVEILYNRPTASTLGQDCTLNITLNISAVTNAMNLDGDATYGEVGDMWIGGEPAAVFGGYHDALSASTTTNLNTGALGAPVQFSIVIPSGTTTTIDTSIFGVENSAGGTWDQYIKIKSAFALVDQATCDVTVTARNGDGGFGKTDAVYTGDVAVPQTSLVNP